MSDLVPVRGVSAPVSALPTRRRARELERALARRARPAMGLRLVRAVAPRIVPVAAMGVVALLTVGMSIPASAFASGQDSAGGATDTAAGPSQALSVSGDAGASAVARDGYGFTSRATYEAAARAAAEAAAAAQRAAEAAQRAAAAKKGNAFQGRGPVRWPFPSAVPLGSGFGAPGACQGCQPIHQGQDFQAGEGAEIYSVAAGIVTSHEESGGLGDHLVITHRIAGHTVSSLYAHMQSGSSPLKVGDRVAVGQLVGLVGTTGTVTGPHLHLEIAVDGTRVDPYLWLVANVH